MRAEPPAEHGVELMAEAEPAETEDARGWSISRELTRIRTHKLSWIDPLELKSRRNAEGQSAMQYIEAQLTTNATKGAQQGKQIYLTMEFWKAFNDSFKFSSEGFFGLRKVDPTELTRRCFWLTKKILRCGTRRDGASL